MVKTSGLGGFGALRKEPVGSAGVWTVLRLGVFLFLVLNLWYRFSTVFDYSRFVGGLFIFLGLCSLGVVLFPKLLRTFLFLFGASFFMFGFRAYDLQSQVFETIVVFVAVTVFIHRLRRFRGLSEEGEGKGGLNPSEMRSAVVNEFHGVNRQLVGLILCYLGLSVLSLMLLPLGHIVKDFWFLGLKTFLCRLPMLLRTATCIP